MLADAVSRIVGDLAEVSALMGPGVDPHMYQATPGDLRQINQADLTVYNGLFLEGKLDDTFRKLARTRNIINFSSAIDPSNLIEVTDPQYENELYDPHIWFDIDIWIAGMKGLADAIITFYPDWKETVESNLTSYAEELTALKTELRELISSIPHEDRIMVTSHDAFQYFGRMLSIRVEALMGISTATEFGLQDRKQLTDLIVEEGIKALFIESSVSDKPIQAILDDCRSRGVEVTLGGTLFSDAMGDPKTPEGTYIGMWRHNVRTVVNGLK